MSSYSRITALILLALSPTAAWASGSVALDYSAGTDAASDGYKSLDLSAEFDSNDGWTFNLDFNQSQTDATGKSRELRLGSSKDLSSAWTLSLDLAFKSEPDSVSGFGLNPGLSYVFPWENYSTQLSADFEAVRYASTVAITPRRDQTFNLSQQILNLSLTQQLPLSLSLSLGYSQYFYEGSPLSSLPSVQASTALSALTDGFYTRAQRASLKYKLSDSLSLKAKFSNSILATDGSLSRSYGLSAKYELSDALALSLSGTRTVGSSSSASNTLGIELEWSW